MQSKYGKDGFQAVSVNLDDPNDKKMKEKVVKFLQEKKANTLNLMLNEKPEVWEKKLQIVGFPVVFIFDRQGHREKKLADGVDYKDVEKIVVELLKKK